MTKYFSKLTSWMVLRIGLYNHLCEFTNFHVVCLTLFIYLYLVGSIHMLVCTTLLCSNNHKPLEKNNSYVFIVGIEFLWSTFIHIV